MSSNYQHGHDAEEFAVKYLEKNGYRTLEINWKTRWCEIDIITSKDNCIFFIEVKYRRSSNNGTGLDYITPKKLKQMTFAAEMWIASHNWHGEYQLAAIEVGGNDFTVSNFVTDIS
ncbi:YraN family protein [Candidatus Saccharibacteria bacterium]|nr:YraN family protein [Candidatus Saccharibacteria bacterium]